MFESQSIRLQVLLCRLYFEQLADNQVLYPVTGLQLDRVMMKVLVLQMANGCDDEECGSDCVGE